MKAVNNCSEGNAALTVQVISEMLHRTGLRFMWVSPLSKRIQTTGC
jgi:hypothetical protein